MTIRDAVVEIFNKEKRPLHYKEITERLLPEYRIRGKTPHETVRSKIGTDRRFKRVGEGIYALADWEEYVVARFAKDIAYEVLKSRKCPMTLTDLGEAILEERNFLSAPSQVARNAIRQDERFYYDREKNLVGLTEWQS